MIEFILITFFIAASLFIAALFTLMKIRHSGGKRLVNNRLEELSKDKIKNSENPSFIRDDQLSKIPLLNRILEKLHISKRLHRLIVQADISLKVGELTLLILVFSMIGLLLMLRSGNLIFMLLGSLSTGILPLLYVNIRRSKRLKSFIREFPDALDMMTSALKAGHAFNMAMHLVASEAPDPVGVEFRKTFEENSLGLPLKEALFNLTQRVDSIDLRLLVAAVLLQRETGGNLTEILSKISHTIRERFKLMGEMKVHTAQGRLSMWILGTLPIAFAMLMKIMNPDYLTPLFENKTGNHLLIIAFVLQIIGFLIIRKIVNIKFQ